MNEANSTTVKKPSRIRIVLDIILFVLFSVAILLALFGYTIIWEGQPYSITGPKKMAIWGTVHLKGYPKENIKVRIDSGEIKMTDTVGNFVFSNLNPKVVHTIEVETDYGKVKRMVDGKKGVLNLGVIEAVTNIALGKPVAYNYTQNIEQKGEKIVITSHPQYYEKYCIEEGYYSYNLTDGDESTMFYPASFFFEVFIDLLKTYDIREVQLVWGSHGLSENHLYISDWRMDYAEIQPKAGSGWTKYSKRNTPPGEEVTTINEQFTARYLKLFVESKPQIGRTPNWIGMYEVKAYGMPAKGQAK